MNGRWAKTGHRCCEENALNVQLASRHSRSVQRSEEYKSLTPEATSESKPKQIGAVMCATKHAATEIYCLLSIPSRHYDRYRTHYRNHCCNQSRLPRRYRGEPWSRSEGQANLVVEIQHSFGVVASGQPMWPRRLEMLVHQCLAHRNQGY